MKTELDNINPLFLKIAELIELVHQKVVNTVNLAMVNTYFEIGKMIVEEEQQGKSRAEYGKAVLKEVSIKLTEKFGNGFSEVNLRQMRNFYEVYSIRFTISWSHYLVLMRIENANERSFYEIEATNENWSLSTLKRQYHSSLYERLALSRDKDEVMKLATKGNTVEKPSDILKNPLTLEFLGLEEKSAYSESDLEEALLSKIQHFLLELGKGFLFEARQKRFTFDGEHFFVDLVFYNRLLQCYVLIDLKIKTLKHKDIGQMQMYVNYYDRNVKLNYEKPTIGILLCKKKNDAIVELTLPEDTNIYASEYSLYLPDKQLLQQKLVTWMQEYEDGH
jgi:predicted nuclease of restriction endonuclease-like (RecB) superfamily